MLFRGACFDTLERIFCNDNLTHHLHRNHKGNEKHADVEISKGEISPKSNYKQPK